MPLDKDKPVSGELSPPLELQVRKFIEINKAALLDYWNLNTTTDEFIERLHPVA